MLQEMQQLRIQHKMSVVNVEVDTPVPVDLSKVLQDVRQEYESLVMKNKLELEKWYQMKVRCEHNLPQIYRTAEESE